MNIIDRNNIFIYIIENPLDITIHTFKKSDVFFEHIHLLVKWDKTIRKIQQDLRQHYIEAKEFCLDFENGRFFANGVGRIFKIRYMDDPLDDPSQEIEERGLETVDLGQKWFDKNTYVQTIKHPFKSDEQRVMCNNSLLIPTRTTFDLSVKYLNVKREIKMVEW